MDMKLRKNKKTGQEKKDFFSVFTMVIALLVIFFIGSAVCAIVAGGLPSFIQTIREREVQFALRFSAVTATLSTLLVMLLALPTAYALTRTSMPLKGLSGIVIELTLSLPYLLLGLSLLIIFSSPFGKWMKDQGFKVVFSPAGIIMAHILVNLPYAIRLIRTAFEASDQRLEFIACTLGASSFRCFLTILLPICQKSLLSTAILTWSRALGEFGATLMLVGITRFKTETLPGSIYLSISTGNNEQAMSTATLMLVISGAVLFLSHLLNRPSQKTRRQVFFYE